MTTIAHANTPRLKDMVRVEGGRFLMGSEDFYPEERPVPEVAVDGFWIDRHPVTNADYPDADPAPGGELAQPRGAWVDPARDG